MFHKISPRASGRCCRVYPRVIIRTVAPPVRQISCRSSVAGCSKAQALSATRAPSPALGAFIVSQGSRVEYFIASFSDGFGLCIRALEPDPGAWVGTLECRGLGWV